ncbi:hypothetical protein I7I50_07527 [Histoplasma capsulatum G186AR]|uniref:Uncharacterized protein n=1 Tax=Ajellomyces capsulatus TaxID=5037 RepID=A0A8H7YVD3_AJECA|nr:hypothetical protein I7I52_09401 [Histoplasma capsulatum]QSS68196.1 hypothetical protein I7I50_07527 [Histoplasma capsulatum G186AR]
MGAAPSSSSSSSPRSSSCSSDSSNRDFSRRNRRNSRLNTSSAASSSSSNHISRTNCLIRGLGTCELCADDPPRSPGKFSLSATEASPLASVAWRGSRPLRCGRGESNSGPKCSGSEAILSPLSGADSGLEEYRREARSPLGSFGLYFSACERSLATASAPTGVVGCDGRDA